MGKIRLFSSVFTIFLFLSFLFSACSPGADGTGDDTGVSALEGKLLILQVYGTGAPTDGAVSHSFIELYNTSAVAIDLTGLSVQYADGYVFPAVSDGPWQKINLEGSIGAKSSFLILGAKRNPGANLQIQDNYGDINRADMVLSNRSFKVALMHNQNLLTVQNPFNTDGGLTKAMGYIDMVGAVNNDELDKINGYESEKTRMTKQSSIRRVSLAETNNNMIDFERITYNRIKNDAVPYYRPHNSKTDGQWDPMIRPPLVENQTLMLFQVYAGSDNGSAGTHAFAELYNNSASPIDLDGYSLQYANGAGKGIPVVNWSKLNLTGTIPAYSSFLIRGAPTYAVLATGGGRLQITAFDMDAPSFAISNRNFKVALMSNQTTLATANPFDTDGDGTLATGFVDLLGATNTGSSDYIDAFKGAPFNDISKQKAARRKSLDSVEDNKSDFESIDYRSLSGSNGISDGDLLKYQPRTTAAAPYFPVF